MNLVELAEKDVRIEVPASWDEMTPEQAKYCLRQAVLASRGMITGDEARTRCLYYLLDIERDATSVMKERMLTPEQLQEKNSRIVVLCDQLVPFVFDKKENGQLEIAYRTVMNHFPVLKAGKTLLYGPGHILGDLSFGELRVACEEMQAYFDTKDEDHLSQMIACLYRPERKDWQAWQTDEKFDGRRREPFNSSRVEINAQLTAKVGVVERTAVLLWFTYCLQHLQAEDMMISGRQLNFSPLFPKSTEDPTGPVPPDQRGAGWTGLLFRIAKEGLFGPMETVDRAAVYDILVYMYETHLENLKAKAKNKKK